MLKRLQLTNFKSWENVDIDCGKITGIFGANSSGKSSLFQFLLLLKQTKNATDRAISLELNGDYVKLGAIRDAIHRHDTSRSIDFTLDFDPDDTPEISDPAPDLDQPHIDSGESLSLSASVEVDGEGAPVARRLEYGLGKMKFRLAPRDGETRSFDLTALGPQECPPAKNFSFIRTKGRAWQLPGPVKSYAFPDQARTYYQNAGFLSDLEAAYEREIDRLFYLGPLREYPQRDYLWARSRPTDVGQRGEKVIDAILAATAANETRNLSKKKRRKPFQEIIAHWLREMGLVDHFAIEEIAEGSNRWQARVRVREGAEWVLLTDVGVGVSQVLPVITLLQYVPEGSTVLLEQPEIHLHPLAQSALADVIIQAATHRRVQIFLESHSEHLLLRLQRRIAEGELSGDDVKLYFCDAPRGVSQLKSLELDEFGKIGNWPENFMGDAFGETASAEEARLERMIRG